MNIVREICRNGVTTSSRKNMNMVGEICSNACWA